jgi:hypothetical protein
MREGLMHLKVFLKVLLRRQGGGMVYKPSSYHFSTKA